MTCFPVFFFLTENENDIYGFLFRNFLATNFDFVGFREYKYTVYDRFGWQNPDRLRTNHSKAQGYLAI